MQENTQWAIIIFQLKIEIILSMEKNRKNAYVDERQSGLNWNDLKINRANWEKSHI